MGVIELSGKTISIDLSKVTVGDWRGFFKGGNTTEEDDLFLQKVTGMTQGDIENMLRDDWRRLIVKISEIGREPLADPNSQSSSTSD